MRSYIPLNDHTGHNISVISSAASFKKASCFMLMWPVPGSFAILLGSCYMTSLISSRENFQTRLNLCIPLCLLLVLHICSTPSV